MQILNGIFTQNACFFLHLVEGNGKKLRKISLSSKTSQGEDTWTATIAAPFSCPFKLYIFQKQILTSNKQYSMFHR